MDSGRFDDQFVGMLGMHGTLEANKTMHNSDCIIALGARFDDRVTNNVEKFFISILFFSLFYEISTFKIEKICQYIFNLFYMMVWSYAHIYVKY